MRRRIHFIGLNPNYYFEGRIQALANVHSLFVESRWIGAAVYFCETEASALFEAQRSARAN